MKKIIILILILNFSANSIYATCSLTGGACAIDDLMNKTTNKTIQKKITKSKYQNNKNIKKKFKKSRTKNYGQNNIDRNSN